MNDTRDGIIIEEIVDPEELAKAQAQDERFERNWAWFNAHASEIYTKHRGKCLCVAGEELFVADTPAEALAQARAAHPEDDGFFTRIIPRERVARIYDHHGARQAVASTLTLLRSRNCSRRRG